MKQKTAKTKIGRFVGEGTIVRGGEYADLYMVAQVAPGLYLLINAYGNRWQDRMVPRDNLPVYLKQEGFRVVRQGGGFR